MSAANIDHTNLNAVESGGVVRESVMNKIWEIDKFPLVLTDMCSSGTHGNQYNEYTTDELGEAATDNATIDGADLTGNDASLGERVGNYTQTATKIIQVSTRANAADSIGRMGSLSYQVSQNQKRLRRDVEAQMCTAQASVAGDGTAVAGVSAGIGAWLETNVDGGVDFVAGGFDPATNLIDAPTFGTARALSEALVRDIAQAVYEQGGETMYVMARPVVIRLMSEYLMTSGKIATQMNDNASGTGAMTAYGSNNVFVTDFGQVLKMIPNRLQPQTAVGASAMYFLDPKHLEQSFMRGYRTEPLGKTGLSEKRIISVDYQLNVLNEKSQGAIFDIDEDTPMVA